MAELDFGILIGQIVLGLIVIGVILSGIRIIRPTHRELQLKPWASILDSKSLELRS